MSTEITTPEPKRARKPLTEAQREQHRERAKKSDQKRRAKPEPQPEPIPEPDPTGSQFGAYGKAFDYFNATLFGGTLPRCLLNFSRHSRKTMGFFSPQSWRSGDRTTHEISLNPDVLLRPPIRTFATLVHEMCHLWQREFGSQKKSGYHDAQWAAKMESVGLMPSDTGEFGGKRTGYQVTHYIIDGGAYDRAFQAIPPAVMLPWTSGVPGTDGKERKNKDKVKYTCPGCGGKMWGKSGMNDVCGDCDVPRVEEAKAV